jgi:hypothetical protein
MPVLLIYMSEFFLVVPADYDGEVKYVMDGRRNLECLNI